MTRIRLLALALLTVGFTACLDATNPQFATVEGTTFDPALEVDLAASTRTEVGVYYRDIVEGSGPVIASGQDSYMFYRAYLSNGTEIDSLRPPTPRAFRIGNSSLVPGFEIGLQGMKIGSTRQILVPPSLAYGMSDLRDADNNVLIPGNSVLVFFVELVNADGSTGATTTP
jgi:FKBP-type peptidyl-prolyl cis-trans isomerase